MICLPCHQVSLFHINRMRPLALALWILAFGLGGQGRGRLLILKGSSSRRCHRHWQRSRSQPRGRRETPWTQRSPTLANQCSRVRSSVSVLLRQTFKDYPLGTKVMCFRSVLFICGGRYIWLHQDAMQGMRDPAQGRTSSRL